MFFNKSHISNGSNIEQAMFKRQVCSSGFTLLQLMFVIAIAGAISAASIEYSSVQSEQIKLNKAAYEIQAVLEAAIHYHLNTGAWPANIASLLTRNYLPDVPDSQGGMNNPWGNRYNIYAESGGSTLRLHTQLGSNDRAKYLTSILPNSTIDGADSTWISTRVSLHLTADEMNEDFIVINVASDLEWLNEVNSGLDECEYPTGEQPSLPVIGKAFEIPKRYQDEANTLCAAAGKTADYQVFLQAFKTPKHDTWMYWMDGGLGGISGLQGSSHGMPNTFYDIALKKQFCGSKLFKEKTTRWGAALELTIEGEETYAGGMSSEYGEYGSGAARGMTGKIGLITFCKP